jgi:hypothetical protein
MHPALDDGCRRMPARHTSPSQTECRLELRDGRSAGPQNKNDECHADQQATATASLRGDSGDGHLGFGHGPRPDEPSVGTHKRPPCVIQRTAQIGRERSAPRNSRKFSRALVPAGLEAGDSAPCTQSVRGSLADWRFITTTNATVRCTRMPPATLRGHQLSSSRDQAVSIGGCHRVLGSALHPTAPRREVRRPQAATDRHGDRSGRC